MKADIKARMAAAEKFLTILDSTGVFTFQTFDDDKNRKDPSLARVLHGTLQDCAPELLRLQDRGAGAFVMVNRGDGVLHPGNRTCRTAANVIVVRALFLDLDGSPMEPVLAALQPDMVLESSPGRWHCYWLVSNCPLADFKARQQQIAVKFNGDRSVNDLPRVMRLPGFLHQKAAPFRTRVAFPE